MKIFTINKVNVHEINGTDCTITDKCYLKVVNHWNIDRLVKLSIHINGKKSTTVTVCASQLEKAIRNATNV